MGDDKAETSHAWSGALAKLVSALGGKDSPSGEPASDELKPRATGNAAADENLSSLPRALMGPIGALGEYYFPVEVIGGCCPRIVGEEEEIAWHAAAEAVDSERIHIVWQTQGDHIWFLAVRSAEMASHAGTWCPFASLLPGMKDAANPPVCYTYFSEEAATMMTVTDDRLQIHRGTASVVRAKAERVARELNNAPVIDLIPDRITKLTPLPWYSVSLFEERARRILAAVAVVAAIAFAGLGVFIWLFAAMATVSTHGDRDEILARSEQKSLQLMKSAQALRASPMREQLAKFADLNDGLISLNGMLEIYQIKGGKVLWRAIVPPNVTADRITEIGGQTLDSSPQKVVIGNSRDALKLDKK
jgi:hypothetical protein